MNQQIPVGSMWMEPFEDFTLWLQEMGAKAENLPTWHGAVPTRVIAVPSKLYIERVTRKEFKAWQSIKGLVPIPIPLNALDAMVCIEVRDYDEKLLKAWKEKNPDHFRFFPTIKGVKL